MLILIKKKRAVKKRNEFQNFNFGLIVALEKQEIINHEIDKVKI